jgi:RimJ/RimL family protein N-acetyltransferase
LQFFTARLEFRSADEAAAASLCAIAADPRVRNDLYLDPPRHPPGWDVFRDEARAPEAIRLAARLRSEGTIVGAALVDDGYLWYFVDPLLWGRGYGGEIVAGACDALAVHAPTVRLKANVARDNIASVRLLERVGFRFCGLVQSPRRRAVLRYAR